MQAEQKRLNVGCGRNTLEGWINLDIVKLPGVDIVADLNDCSPRAIPLEDSSIGEFLLSHLIEHIERPLPLLEELWRIAIPGARMVIRVPHGASDDAWEDPTHLRPYFSGSFGYFSQPFYWRADYGYRGDWQLDKLSYLVRRQAHEALPAQQIMEKIKTQRNVVLELIAELTCVKPAREPKRDLQTSAQIHILLVDRVD